MAITYLGFKAKFSPAFEDLVEAQFNAHLADALADVNRIKWELFGANFQVFKDRATENYIACKLSQLNPEYLGAAGLSEFEVREAGYKIKYVGSNDAKGLTNNPYCAEYARLVGEAEKLNPDKSLLPQSSTYIKNRVYWQ